MKRKKRLPINNRSRKTLLREKCELIERNASLSAKYLETLLLLEKYKLENKEIKDRLAWFGNYFEISTCGHKAQVEDIVPYNRKNFKTKIIESREYFPRELFSELFGDAKKDLAAKLATKIVDEDLCHFDFENDLYNDNVRIIATINIIPWEKTITKLRFRGGRMFPNAINDITKRET